LPKEKNIKSYENPLFMHTDKQQQCEFNTSLHAFQDVLKILICVQRKDESKNQAGLYSGKGKGKAVPVTCVEGP
jgi:hypothetical protein